MNMRRTFAVARKVLRSLRHDRRTAAFLVLMPLFMIAIFGYTFGGDLREVSVCIVNLDGEGANGSISSSIIDDLGSRDTLKIVSLVGPGNAGPSDIASAISRVEKGEALAAIVFEEDFTERALEALASLRRGEPAFPGEIAVHVDSSNPNVAQAVVSELQISLQTTLVAEYHLVPPILVDENRVYGEGAEFIDFFAPGVMGLAAMMVTSMLSIVSFVHERSYGTLDRLLTTPVTEGEIVGGYALALGFIAFIQSCVILVTAILAFNIQIVGNVLLALFTIFLLGIGSQGLGFLLSSNAKTEFQAVQFMPIVLFPSILLAGVFWPIEAIPDFLRPISYFVPLTYAVEGCRSVMIRGWGIEEVWPQLVVLAVFAAAMLLLSTYSLKKRR